MQPAKRQLDDLRQELETQRDDLKVRLHLAKADARDEWEKVEKRWEKLRAKLDVAGDEASEVAGDVGDAAKLLLGEIREGYQRLRKLL